MRFGPASEKNEVAFENAVDLLIYQMELYDRIWYVRHMPAEGDHSEEGLALAAEFIAAMKRIKDGCAELFPYEAIAELQQEYFNWTGDTASIVDEMNN